MYASVADLRAEGVTAAEANDARLELLLVEASSLIDRVTGWFFEPRLLTLHLAGRGAPSIELPVPPLRVDRLVLGRAELSLDPSELLIVGAPIQPGFDGPRFTRMLVDCGLGQRQLHRAGCAFAGWRDHVVAIGIGGVANDLAIDLGPAGLGALIVFQHHDPGSAGDHEAVPISIERARGAMRLGIVLGRHGAHGVEQVGQRPVELLAAAGEHDVLLAPLDEFRRIANAVGGCRTG